MENVQELTKDQIINEVKRTGILREHHLSATAVKLISTYYNYDLLIADGLFEEKHIIAFIKLILETFEECSRNDLEIINLVYESPVKTLKVNTGYVELFANHTIIHHKEGFPGNPIHAFPYLINQYIDKNIEIVIAAHDKQYLDPEALTEADRNEIFIASLSDFRFEYESDLRTVHSMNDYYKGRPWLRTLTLKRPKPTALKFVGAAIGRLDITYFSEYGQAIVVTIAYQNQHLDADKFLKIQSGLHLLERNFLTYLKEPEHAEKIEDLKKDLSLIQAFKDASANIDQIIYPKAEILVFSDRSVLFVPEGEEPESHLDIYQFIMNHLKYFQSAFFLYSPSGTKSRPDPASSQLRKYGIEFSIVNEQVITKFTREFRNRLFKAANIQLV